VVGESCTVSAEESTVVPVDACRRVLLMRADRMRADGPKVVGDGQGGLRLSHVLRDMFFSCSTEAGSRLYLCTFTS
jgi:hypothetical protein